MAKATLLNLEALLNDQEAFDAIQEAPDFMQPPAGLYRLKANEAKIDKYESKDEPGIEKQRLVIMYSIVSTLATDEEQPVPDGSLFRETFMATEQGIGYFKKRIKEILKAEDTAGVSLADMMTSVAGEEFYARITVRKTPKKDSPNEHYENINIRIISEPSAEQIEALKKS